MTMQVKNWKEKYYILVYNNVDNIRIEFKGLVEHAL